MRSLNSRSVVMAQNGLIATSQPLASAAGLRVLQEGGNAIDAAVTAAAVLAVVEPTMTGIGGDLFAIVYEASSKSVAGLNASGRSAASANARVFSGRGLDSVPARGVLSVSVPGVVDGWSTLLGRYGTRDLARTIEPAIGYARTGFAVSEIIAGQWKDEEAALAADPAAAATFLIGGRAPAPGQIFRNPNLATTLDVIASGGCDAFYRGPIAAAIAEDMRRRQGLLTEGDFDAHASEWVEPISTTYRGHHVLELPPNTQGAVALEMLNLLEGFDLGSMRHNSAGYLHLLVEAKRIAFADREAWLADAAAVPPQALARMLSKSYAAERRREIDPGVAAVDYAPLTLGAATPVASARQVTGDTVYLTAADREGNVISLIQSIFAPFGAAIVAGTTGIVLHNRGSLFSLRPDHPNVVAPRKRPFHTLIPAMVLDDGVPWLSFGVMGGDMQPQGHTQVLLNLIDFGMTVQEAAEAPRFRHSAAGLALEPGVSADARAGLAERGHTLITTPGAFGGFQGILFDRSTGVMMGGSDPRKDGLAIGW